MNCKVTDSSFSWLPSQIPCVTLEKLNFSTYKIRTLFTTPLLYLVCLFLNRGFTWGFENTSYLGNLFSFQVCYYRSNNSAFPDDFVLLNFRELVDIFLFHFWTALFNSALHIPTIFYFIQLDGFCSLPRIINITQHPREAFVYFFNILASVDRNQLACLLIEVETN